MTSFPPTLQGVGDSLLGLFLPAPLLGDVRAGTTPSSVTIMELNPWDTLLSSDGLPDTDSMY